MTIKLRAPIGHSLRRLAFLEIVAAVWNGMPPRPVARRDMRQHPTTNRKRKRGAAPPRPVPDSAYRIGGAYCKPPFDQMLLIPRGTPIGVMSRSQTSPKLPTCLITL